MQSKPSSSVGYAQRLSRGHYRGTLNLQPAPDPPLLVLRKVKILAEMVRAAETVVLHTGAGVSTSCGINDFRGPEGVWTKEAKKLENGTNLPVVEQQHQHGSNDSEVVFASERKRSREETMGDKRGRGSLARRRRVVDYVEETEKEQEDDSFDLDVDRKNELPNTLKNAMCWASLPKPLDKSVPTAVPSLAHMVMSTMIREDFVQCIVTQNVDNLHTRSGVKRNKLAELHGNIMVEYCPSCETEYQRDYEIESTGFEFTGNSCAQCGGGLTDKALDWDDELPKLDLDRANSFHLKAQLHIAVGTSCQMNPSRDLLHVPKEPLRTVIINLSRTERDDKAGLVIRAPADMVFALLAKELEIPIEPYVHNSLITFVARPASDVARRIGKFGNVLFGLRTALGADDDMKMPIPFIQNIVYTVNGFEFSSFQNEKDLACTANCSDIADSVLTISAKLTLLDNRNEFFELKYVGDKVSVSKSIIVSKVKYTDEAEKYINIVNKKAKDTALNKAYLRRDNICIWYMVDKKSRHYRCTICGTERLFRGGRNVAANLTNHVESCLSKQFDT